MSNIILFKNVYTYEYFCNGVSFNKCINSGDLQKVNVNIRRKGEERGTVGLGTVRFRW